MGDEGAMGLASFFGYPKKRSDGEVGQDWRAAPCCVIVPLGTSLFFASRRDERTAAQAPQYGSVDRPARSERPMDCLVCIPRREPESGLSSDRPASYG